MSTAKASVGSLPDQPSPSNWTPSSTLTEYVGSVPLMSPTPSLPANVSTLAGSAARLLVSVATSHQWDSSPGLFARGFTVYSQRRAASSPTAAAAATAVAVASLAAIGMGYLARAAPTAASI